MPVTYIPNPLLQAELARSPELRAGMLLLAEEVAQKAADLAPRETGRLAASIAAHPGTDATHASAEVLADVEYAAFVEFGTSKMAPSPYLRPALEAIVGR